MPCCRTLARLTVALLPALLIAGCGDAGGGVSSTGKPDPRSTGQATRPVRIPARPPVRRPLPAPQVLAVPGAEGVIGATGAELVRQFGAPRLDVMEGDARKLQYSGSACVLDLFLYPAAPGREPQATYIEARRASDGREVDRAACIAAMRAGGR